MTPHTRAPPDLGGAAKGLRGVLHSGLGMIWDDPFKPGRNGIDGLAQRMTVGGAELSWHAVDTRLYNVNLYHFAHALGKSTTNVLFWAVTVVNAPREIPGVRLAIGSNAASVWWVSRVRFEEGIVELGVVRK
jgi:hypothetical protein